MKKSILILVTFTLIFSACSSSSTSEDASGSETQCGEPLLSTDSKPSVEIQTNLGSFTIELDTQNAQESASHFAALTEEGFYDDLIFHRVVPGFVIQGGDPQGTGMGSSECKVISEAPKEPYALGDVAWAKTGEEPAGTAGSQFFVMTASSDLPLDYGYIGKVVDGIEVVQQIESVETDQNDRPLEDVVMTKVEIKS